MERTPLATSSQMRWIVAVWIILGCVTSAQVVVGMRAVGMHHNWTALFLTTLAGWMVLALAAPVVLWLSRRFPVGKGHWRNLALHASAAIAVGFLHAGWTAVLEWGFNPLAEFPKPSFRFVLITALYSRFHTGLIIYCATVVIRNTIDSIRRLAQRDAEAARLESELTKEQLSALRRQLEPHFLFNTLNGIANLVREGRSKEAVGMIAGLSSLLRRSLEDSGRQLVPLSEEMWFLESYVELQLMRFGDRLKVTMEVPPELYTALVPPLILQPLVENAIEHGVGKRIEGGEIRVTVSAGGGNLAIRITNDGPALALAAAARRSGVGIANTRGRLQKLYGSECGLHLRNREEAGVEAEVTVPYRVEE